MKCKYCKKHMNGYKALNINACLDCITENKTLHIKILHTASVALFTIALLVLFLPTLSHAKRLNHEKYYQEITCSKINGIIEYVLEDKTRIDCLTKTHAIEHDFANKWAESIGQSLHYASMTGKRAGIYLILEKQSDNKYYSRLIGIVNHYNLPIDVWKIENYEGEMQ